MTNPDEIKAAFEKKLDRQAQEHAERLRHELEVLRAGLPADLAVRLKSLGRPAAYAAPGVGLQAAQTPAAAPPPGEAWFAAGGRRALRQLDRVFVRTFDLRRYYSAYALETPLYFCETLEDFFSPILSQADLTPASRRAELQRMAAASHEHAETKGGGMLGYNLPSQGCYLNGWLLAYGSDLEPGQALNDERVLHRALLTAVHEKLGHGFLEAYGALGAVSSRLGRQFSRLAQAYGLSEADDPAVHIRQGKAALIGGVSRLLEEGWATWLESYFDAAVFRRGPHPRHSLPGLIEAAQALPAETPDGEALQEGLLAALGVLFAPEPLPQAAVQRAVQMLHFFDDLLGDYFSQALGQPLRYVVGELLFLQAALGLGPRCLPYAALIAANVSLDPEAISLADLRETFTREPRYNPDVRMALLSRLRLEQPNSVPELVARAGELNLSSPRELQ